MFFFLNFLSFSIPLTCEKGLFAYFWCFEPNCSPPKNVFFLQNISSTNGHPQYNGFGFKGSFCPHITANYQMIIEGTYTEYNENQWSFFNFHNYTSKNRISPFFFLVKGYCYKFNIWAATGIVNSYGSLYFKQELSNKFLLNSSNSYSCFETFCLNNYVSSKFNSKFTKNNQFILVLLFDLFL